MSLWEKGKAKTGGRMAGTRNKLSAACLKDALASYEKHGAAAWEILAQESPRDFLKCIQALMPQDIEITTNKLAELDDTQLEAVIAYVTRLVGGGLADRLEDRTGETAH